MRVGQVQTRKAIEGKEGDEKMEREGGEKGQIDVGGNGEQRQVVDEEANLRLVVWWVKLVVVRAVGMVVAGVVGIVGVCI